MELNWSTFLLEILNFLVLLWILKRFLYRPVLDTLARRQAGIEQALQSAEATRAEALALQAQYENRLGEWGEEREAEHEKLRREMNEERQRLLAALAQELEREREKARVLDEKLQADALRKYQESALAQGDRFVALMLSELAGQELETRLFELALRQIDSLPEERRDSIRLACEDAPEAAEAVTAYPLDGECRQRLTRKLGELVGMPVVCHFREDPGLLAGLRVTLGPWVFQANLQDELSSFTASAYDPG
jgi:F-type H+-transporting ATPase subunit b